MPQLRVIPGGAERTRPPRQKPNYTLFAFQNRAVIRLDRPGGCPAELVLSHSEATAFMAELFHVVAPLTPPRAARR
jgi:hypothetical protein